MSDFKRMTDSDSEFSDAGEDVCNDNIAHNDDKQSRLNKNGVRVRGPDLSWIELQKFPNSNEYKNSDIAKKLEEEFSCRRKREFDYADVLDFECKHKRKVGFLPCPWKFKVCF